MIEMKVDESILQVQNLSIGYRLGRSWSEVACDINLTLKSGTVTCLLGANGVGKSTLLRTLSGRQPALSGKVTISGYDISKITPTCLARLISVVYTERTNAGALTAKEVVALGRQPYTGFFGRLSSSDKIIIEESISAVGVENLASRYMATLSDGERQKVMIARALAQRTPVMMLDEPTSFLDVASRLEVMQLLAGLARDYDTAILLSTHDVGSALNIADFLWLMGQGKNIISGAKQDIIDRGEMDKLFPERNIIFDSVAMDFRISKP